VAAFSARLPIVPLMFRWDLRRAASRGTETLWIEVSERVVSSSDPCRMSTWTPAAT
jgi:hypothetical protein